MDKFTKEELRWIIKQAKQKQKTAVGVALLTKVFEIERKAVKKMNYIPCCDTCKDKGSVAYWHETGMGIKPCECRKTK